MNKLYHCFHVFVPKKNGELDYVNAVYLDHSQGTWNEYRLKEGEWHTFPIEKWDEAKEMSPAEFLRANRNDG